jgi:hypothetical protein
VKKESLIGGPAYVLALSCIAFEKSGHRCPPSYNEVIAASAK